MDPETQRVLAIHPEDLSLDLAKPDNLESRIYLTYCEKN